MHRLHEGDQYFCRTIYVRCVNDFLMPWEEAHERLTISSLPGYWEFESLLWNGTFRLRPCNSAGIEPQPINLTMRTPSSVKGMAL